MPPPREPSNGLVAALLVAMVAAGCTAAEDRSARSPAAEPTSDRPASESPASTQPASPAPKGATPTTPAPVPVDPVSVLGLAQQEHVGDRLQLGAVRERTAAYTSYDVSYRSRSTTADGEESLMISGVLNVPTGEGPFPAVVLAHGYIDPAVYVQGQGMTRERGYLAERGYVALHVDYRNHAASDDDPHVQLDMRLGYVADVINAVTALRASEDVPVADDRMALFGRSMGGGVVLKALAVEPGLVQAAAPWAAVSSLEAENFDRFIRSDPGDDLETQLTRRHGTPEQAPEFWLANSSQPHFDRVTEPVLLVHGRYDDTCPPRWAQATQRALQEAGAESQLQWYDDGHAFGPAFEAAMDRTVDFFDEHLR